MEVDCISYRATGYFSSIIADYLSGSKKLAPFYDLPPTLSSFKTAIANKDFSKQQRETLVAALKQQYENDGISLDQNDLVKQNMEKLGKSNCYTVTTGHQLCLFSGPLYFIYKIVSTIKLSEELAEKYPQNDFVPLFWMASEDHDFEEIAHFRFAGKKITWKSEQSGAVGRMKTDGLDQVFKEFSKALPAYSSHAAQLKKWFQTAYLEHENMAAASRFLIHQLFSEYGLLILDGDDVSLKAAFKQQMADELQHEVSSKLVEQQSADLEKHYKLQVNPREINLFYLHDGRRDRIVKKDKAYGIVGTDLQFSEHEFLQILQEHPERFSPNVLMRPVYQEAILPNLAYIGGGGELAYWFQLKSTFQHFQLDFPILLLRNSALWLDQKQSKYFQKLELDAEQLFLPEGLLLKKWVIANSKKDLILKEEIKQIDLFYTELKDKVARVDASLYPHLAAIAKQAEKNMKKLSEKLIRAERRKNKDAERQIHYLKESLFPTRSLQERQLNFSEFYLAHGSKSLNLLFKAFEVPGKDFKLLFDL